MEILILLLITFLPPNFNIIDRVDVIELNHVYRIDTSHNIDQYIFYNIINGEFEIVDFIVIPSVYCREDLTNKEYIDRLRKFHTKWAKKYPNYKPPDVVNPEFVNARFYPRKNENTGLFYLLLKDRKIISKHFFETWTQYDFEVMSREKLPQWRRKGLKPGR